MCVCVKQLCERKHSADARRAVDQAHEESGKKCDTRRMDDPLHQPRRNGNRNCSIVFFICVYPRVSTK